MFIVSLATNQRFVVATEEQVIHSDENCVLPMLSTYWAGENDKGAKAASSCMHLHHDVKTMWSIYAVVPCQEDPIPAVQPKQ
jgi:hypothetical protein